MTYIPASKHHTLHQFKYTGGTDSITYQYIWSPLAEYLLKSVPLWMAPNLITLIAFLMLLICNIIFMLPDEGDVIPAWKFVMMAVSIVIYQNLDNIDGKQARRTKSSSPLGMLFDHGSDAVSGFLLGAQVLKLLQLQPSFQLFTIYSFIMSTYFCAMWSQYCVGLFKLSRVNPVDEGLPFYALTCLVATQIDLDFLDDYHLVGTFGEQIIYGLCILLIPVCIFMVKDIFKNALVPKRVVMFIPLLYISTGVALYLVDDAMSAWGRFEFYCFFYALAFMWSRNMINMQLYFITKQKFRVFNRGTMSFLLPCLFFYLFNQKLNINSQIFFFVLFVVELVIFLEFVYSVFNEGAQILGIWLFSLKPRLKGDKKENKKEVKRD